MAQQVINVGVPVLAAAWNGDCSRLAVSPNSSEIHIYAPPTTSGGSWACEATLREHHQPVSGLDWAPKSGLLVSCSHDRNAFVWSNTKSTSTASSRSPERRAGATGPGSTASTSAPGWQQQMVITRLTKAALCVRWSPSESKFAIGSGAKAVCVGYFDPSTKWWACRLIKKRHESSVVSVAWHPGSVLLATASTDGRCRVFNAHIPGPDASPAEASPSQFGDCLLEIEAPGKAWVHDLAWACPLKPSASSSSSGSSPGGQHGTSRAVVPLVYCTHNSQVGVVTGAEVALAAGGELQQPASSLVIDHSGLPLKALLALSDRVVVGAGWDGDLKAFSSAGGSSRAGWAQVAVPQGPCTAGRKGSGAGGAAGGGSTGDSNGGVMSLQQRIAALKLQQSASSKALDAPQQSESPADQGGTATASSPAALHNALVTTLLPLKVPSAGGAAVPLPGGLVSLALDGCMVRWDLSSLMPR